MADQGATATQRWSTTGNRPQLAGGTKMVGNSSATGPTPLAYNAQSSAKIPGMTSSGVSGKRKVKVGGVWKDI